jgi:thioredoxin-like negative regulator of GroEL
MVNVADAGELQAAIQAGCAAGRLVAVAFFSPECYACRSLHPKLRQIAAADPGNLLVVKVNGAVEALQAYCDAHGVTKIPYFHLHAGAGAARVAEFTANLQPARLAFLRAQIAAHLPGGGGGNGSSDSGCGCDGGGGKAPPAAGPGAPDGTPRAR